MCTCSTDDTNFVNKLLYWSTKLIFPSFFHFFKFFVLIIFPSFFHFLFFAYSMFHVTWTTFKFNRNQLGTVSAYVM